MIKTSTDPVIKAGGGVRDGALHGGVRALGAVAVAIEVQPISVQTQALDPGVSRSNIS